MKFTHILNKQTPNNKEHLLKMIEQLDPTQRWKISCKPFTQTRTELQNNISFAWYAELADKLLDDDASGYRCFCKLNFAVPIMRAEDEEFRNVYDNVLNPLSYEKKIQIMKYLPVTSLMNTKQISSYLENIKQYFYSNRGIELKFPSDF